MHAPTAPLLNRRHLLLGGAASLALAACGGSGSEDRGFRDRWTTFSMPMPLAMHAAIASADGTVLVTGGSRGASTLSAGIDRFDPGTRRFTAIGEMATGRQEHVPVRVGETQVLVVGGLTSASSWPVAELIDERTGIATPAGAQVQPRIWHSATRLRDGRVVAIGGLGLDSAELWDPATRRWRLAAGRMAHDRSRHTATLLADGRVLVVGGSSDRVNHVFAEVFDPATETFSPLPTGGLALPRRLFHDAHRLADGSVLVLGGSDQESDLEPRAEVWRIDAAATRIAAAPPLVRPRTLVRSALLPGGEVFLAGGQTRSDRLASEEAAIYGPQSQRAAAPMAQARAWHSVTALADGRVLVLGGEDPAGGLLATGALYD